VVIGRQGADINVDDPEISRAHAAVEIAGDEVTLVDLGSTNGTYIGEEQVSEAPLENQAEFTVGGTTLMLIVTSPR
jgi:pSer/pThr/pTyr-binding forkhead associated (FHA) protein